jgi:fatty acid amide hydrolase 2
MFICLQLKSEEVVEAFIARIKEVNSVLNCVVDNRFELALAEARAIDKLIESGDKTEKQLEKEKPFLGVPFTTKDAISVKGENYAHTNIFLSNLFKPPVSFLIIESY